LKYILVVMATSSSSVYNLKALAQMCHYQYLQDWVTIIAIS